MNRSEFLRLLALGAASIPLRSLARPFPAPGKRVLIIGAGMAGAAAAAALRAAGTEVLVLEARSRTGGRIHTDRSLGMPVDLGAAWIHHPRGNPLVPLAEAQQLRTTPTRFTQLHLIEPGGDSLPARRLLRPALAWQRAFRQAARQADRMPPALSLWEALEPRLDPPGDPRLSSLIRQAAETELAASLETVGAAQVLRARLRGAGQDLFMRDGYQPLVDSLLEGVQVLLNQPVQQIVQRGSRVTAYTRETSYEADALILTVPLSILQAGQIEFDPPLPADKREALARMRLGLMNKVILPFEAPCWDTRKQFIVLLGEAQEPDRILVNMHAFTGQPVLAALYVHREAEALEHADPEAVRHSWTARLHRAFPGREIALRTPILTRWRADPYSQGSYSYPHAGALAGDAALLAAPWGRIRFAGEATESQHSSYVHGAYLSGLREARAVLEP